MLSVLIVEDVEECDELFIGAYQFLVGEQGAIHASSEVIAAAIEKIAKKLLDKVAAVERSATCPHRRLVGP
ncbi:MAG TPA: hypothetical protein VM532_01655 [Burkholderiales bacterium]|nr:hypothetical protein [Burkholderiales bacterium]